MTMILYSSTSAKSPVISMVMGDFCYVKVLNSGNVVCFCSGRNLSYGLEIAAGISCYFCIQEVMEVQLLAFVSVAVEVSYPLQKLCDIIPLEI